MASKIYTVTVASGSLYGGGTGNVFYLDGVRNATGPGTVEWVSGATLRFEQSNSSNNFHPLIFSTNTSTSLTNFLKISFPESNFKFTDIERLPLFTEKKYPDSPSTRGPVVRDTSP